jgi:hypothetical protein
MRWPTGLPVISGAAFHRSPDHVTPATMAGTITLALGSLNGGRHNLAGNSGEQGNGRGRFNGQIVGTGEQ